MYGTPDINTDKLCMASSQNPLFLPQLIDPNIKILVMSAAQVSVILILTHIWLDKQCMLRTGHA